MDSKIAAHFAVIYLLLLGLAVFCDTEKLKLQGKKIVFGALPKPEYSYKTKDPEEKWLLASFASIDGYFALLVKSESPYGKKGIIISSIPKPFKCSKCLSVQSSVS